MECSTLIMSGKWVENKGVEGNLYIAWIKGVGYGVEITEGLGHISFLCSKFAPLVEVLLVGGNIWITAARKDRSLKRLVC